MLQSAIKYMSILIAVCTFCACSNTRHLAENETLYKGSKVSIVDNEASNKEKKILESDIIGLVRPVPNKKMLGMRFKLSMYNLAGKPKGKKGFRNWLRNKVGEPPVLTANMSLNDNVALIENYLQNRGYFNAKTSAKFEPVKRKKTSAQFNVTTGEQYIINEVYFKKDSSEVWYDIDSNFKQTLLSKGAPYNLDLIKAERERINRMLKEVGYFYFMPDYILVLADTSIGNHKVNMYVQLKHREIPAVAYRKFHINDIYIHANYRLRRKKRDNNKDDTTLVKDYYIIDKKKTFKPEVFTHAMAFHKGDEYSQDEQNTSLSRLVNMGTFKFVKNQFENIGDSVLDVYYYLTPHPRKSFRFEAGAHTQNDNRAGTKGSVSWRHRNAFRGAEELMFKINGGFEAQYSGPVKQPTIYNFGVELGLTFPRFAIPFMNIQTASRYVPRTSLKLKYNFESSAKLINISSYNAGYGFIWKEGQHKEHQFYPINFTYVNTDTVGSPQSVGILYSNLVFNGIIIGPTYEFTYNSQSGKSHQHSFYFNGRVDLSGNILGLSQNADNVTNPRILFGSTYAQYVKLQPDFRYYLKLSSAATIATRALIGLGVPYGNSGAMPNIKQFWAGGNSDLRGFPSRLVGPGTFNEYDTANAKQFIQTLGDMKLELNIELRQHIYKFINAGLFAEAGNIWLYNRNPAFPGGTFSSNFYKELAADVGAGLRFDFSILVLRLDMGMPIRKPWLAEDSRWVLDKVSFAEKDWRRKNLLFNIAIGYPF